MGIQFCTRMFDITSTNNLFVEEKFLVYPKNPTLDHFFLFYFLMIYF